jgi:N-acetylneuraminic acid mutarotase
VYVLGGETTDCFLLATGEAYDVHTNTWQPIPPLAQVRSYFACAHVVGKVYVVGGWGRDGSMVSMEIFDPATLKYVRVHIHQADLYKKQSSQIHLSCGRWSEGPPMPTPRHLVGCAVVGPLLYVVGGAGDDSENVLDVVEAFDVMTETWHSCCPLPVKLKRLMCGVTNNHLCVIGGEIAGAYQVVHIPMGSLHVAQQCCFSCPPVNHDAV